MTSLRFETPKGTLYMSAETIKLFLICEERAKQNVLGG